MILEDKCQRLHANFHTYLNERAKIDIEYNKKVREWDNKMAFECLERIKQPEGEYAVIDMETHPDKVEIRYYTSLQDHPVKALKMYKTVLIPKDIIFKKGANLK